MMATKRKQTLCPLTTSQEKRQAANELAATVKDNLPPGLSQPALRAFAAAGYSRLDQFTKLKEADLLKLHGVGPKAIRILRAALQDRGQSFLS